MEIDKKQDAYLKVYLKVLNFLSYRRRTVKEVNDRIDKYLKKIVLPSREKSVIREKVISTLKNDGYIKESNDEDFAKFYISSLESSGKSFNKIKIFQFLQKRGISKEVIESSLSEIDPGLIYENVLFDAKKKLRNLKEENKYLKKKKLLNYLSRKGYPFDMVSSVVDTLL
jgi:regulatory protein